MARLATSILFLVIAVPAVAGAEGPEAPPAEQAAPMPDHAWNLSLGTGGGGFVEFVDALAGNVSVSYDSTRRQDRFQLNARADREQGRWFRYGLAYVYNSWTEQYLSGGTPIGSLDNTVHTLMVDATIRWLRTPNVELYSALAAGAGRWRRQGTLAGDRRDELFTGFAFQLRYIGLSAGNDRLRAFLDLGIGFEGLVVGGLTLRL